MRSHLGLLLLIGTITISAAPRTNAQTVPSNRQLAQGPAPQNQTQTRRLALVIGNGAYEHIGRLVNPPNDATLVAATLRLLGFEVTNGTNLPQREMKQRIRAFGQSLRTNGGIGLFYYAGHGVQAKGHNYLVPIDADIQSEADLEDAGVDLNYVLGLMDDAQNALNIVVLDACRNNPFARSFRSAQEGLAQVRAPTGTLIAYATAPDSIAADGTGNNSPYTEELIQQMQIPGVLIETMFRRVTEKVSGRTKGKQEPWFSANVKGDFYFKSGDQGSVVESANFPTKIDPTAFELSYWDSIKNSKDANDFRAYLNKYPEGHFVVLAKTRIHTLDDSAKPAVADANQTDAAYWNQVKDSQNLIDLRSYLVKFPNGLFADLAQNRIAALETAAREAASARQPATVYFYRKSAFSGSGWDPKLYCDGRKIALMDSGRYFGAALDPGKHICRAGDKEGNFEFEVKPNEEYYIKVSVTYFMTGHAKMALVTKQTWTVDMKDVRLLKADKVLDRDVVKIFRSEEK
jgi:hypothetical protein